MPCNGKTLVLSDLRIEIMNNKVLSSFAFLFLVFLSGTVFSSQPYQTWKTIGEQFEGNYLQNLHAAGKTASFDENIGVWSEPLSAAISVYMQAAKSGDADAQFRVALLLKNGNAVAKAEAQKWFARAAENGHEYASHRVNGRKIDAKERCRIYSNMLNTPYMFTNDVFQHVESLALLGQQECIMALGEWFQNREYSDSERALYLLYRGALASSTSEKGGKAWLNLGEFLEKTFGRNDKQVVAMFERAALDGNDKAQGWLKLHKENLGRWAYVYFLQQTGMASLAEFILETFEMSNRTVLHKAPISTWVAPYRESLVSAKSLAVRAGKDIRLVLEKFPVESEEVSAYKYCTNIVRFLTSTAGMKLDGLDRLKLLETSLRILSADFLKTVFLENRIEELLLQEIEEISLSKLEESLERLQLVLILRAKLSSLVNLEKLDSVLQHKLKAFWLNEAKLKEAKIIESGFSYEAQIDEIENRILNISVGLAISYKQGDLLLVVLENVLSNELSQLDFLMRLNDVLVATNGDTLRKNEVADALSTISMFLSLKNLPKNKETLSLERFAKLKKLNESGVSLSSLNFDKLSPFNWAPLLKLESFAKAYKSFQESNIHFGSSVLAATLSPKHISMVKNRFESRLQRLIEEQREFKQNEDNKNYVADARFAQTVSESSLKSHFLAKKQEMIIHTGELLATQKALDSQLMRSGYLGAQKKKLLTSAGLKVFNLVAGEQEQFSAAPSDAKMPALGNSHEGAPGYSHKAIQLNKSDVLNFRVTGEWSPTCAAKRAGFVAPHEVPKIGPEGFRISVSSGDSQTKGNEERHSFSRFTHESTSTSAGFDIFKILGPAIGGIVGSVVGPGGALIGAQVGAMAAAGFSAGDSSQNIKGKSTSSDSSSFSQSATFKSESAAFQSGLRLKDTPYPDAPAGSYLAIAISTEAGRVGEILATVVLSTYSSFVAPSECVVYFVVNDCVAENKNGGLLHVQTQVFRPANVEIAKLVQTMEEQLSSFANKGSLLVFEGGDLSSRIETLKSEVIAALEQSSQIDFMAEPTLRSTFFQWLNNEADVIVRKARIINLSRAIYVTQVELESCEKQQAVHSAHSSALSFRLNQIVKNSQSVPLFDAISEVINYAARYLLPVMQLYHPAEIRSFKGPKLFEADPYSTAQFVARLSAQILQGLDSEIKLPTEEYIIVRIPRPGVVLTPLERRQMPTIDDDRAENLWRHLFIPNATEAISGVRFDFKDLYQLEGRGGLFLGQEMPIVLDMVMLFGLEGASMVEFFQSQFANLHLELHVDRNQVFAQSEGPKRLNLLNDDLSIYSLKTGFIDSSDIVNNAVGYARNEITMNLNTAKGLSPFSDFKISDQSRRRIQDLTASEDIDEHGFPDQIKSVFVVMKIMSTHRNQPMSWIRK